MAKSSTHPTIPITKTHAAGILYQEAEHLPSLKASKAHLPSSSQSIGDGAERHHHHKRDSVRWNSEELGLGIGISKTLD